MRPMRAIMLALTAGVLLAACSNSTPAQGATQANAAPNQADIAFAHAMIPHHQQAIDMAKLVGDRTSRPELRTLAEGSYSPRVEGCCRWSAATPVAARPPVPGRR